MLESELAVGGGWRTDDQILPIVVAQSRSLSQLGTVDLLKNGVVQSRQILSETHVLTWQKTGRARLERA
jgi:hypothetical protein